MTRSCLYFTGCTGFVHHSEYLSSWQYWHFDVWGVLPRRVWVAACVMSPIFQIDNVCVLRHQRILLCHRHVSKQSVIERSVLRRQKTWNSLPSEVTSSVTLSTFKQKLKNYCLTVISRHVISPHIDVQWLQCYCICSLKIMIDWLIELHTAYSVDRVC